MSWRSRHFRLKPVAVCSRWMVEMVLDWTPAAWAWLVAMLPQRQRGQVVVVLFGPARQVEQFAEQRAPPLDESLGWRSLTIL